MYEVVDAAENAPSSRPALICVDRPISELPVDSNKAIMVTIHVGCERTG